MWGLEGRTVLVTGASGGIGGATVRQLVAAGADVIASGRNVEALDDLAAKTGCRTLPFDLASEDSIRRALEGGRPLGSRQLRRVRRRDRDPDGHGHIGLRQGDQRQRERRLTRHQIRVSDHDPSWQGGLDRQRVEPGGAHRPCRPHLLWLLEGSAGQHHSGFRARTGQVQYSREQRESDRRDDGDVGVLLGQARNRRPISEADAARPLGDGG